MKRRKNFVMKHCVRMVSPWNGRMPSIPAMRSGSEIKERTDRVDEKEIFLEIGASMRALNAYEKNKARADFGDWEARFQKETDRLFDRDLNVRDKILRNFRGQQLFVADRPSVRLKTFYHEGKLYYTLKKFLNFFLGTQRGGIREALDAFEVLEDMGFLELLEKYPSPDIGNPLHINHKGYRFTNRYIRHIYLLGLLKQNLEKRLPQNFVAMDIGSSYGIFSSVVKQEFPNSHHILIDMPGQLVLAHYYLAKLFPEAKIAGFKEVSEARDGVDRVFIEKYDFVLLPTSMYELVRGNSADLVTNFISLSEMSREWFNVYMKSPVFLTAPFFYTVNRYDAFPTYQNGITVLDYPLKDYELLFMRNCPFLLNYYVKCLLCGYKKMNYPSQFFQFIGKKKI